MTGHCSPQRRLVWIQAARTLPLLLILSLPVWPAHSRGQTRDDILFRATFDETVEPEISQHASTPNTLGTIAYREGRFGKALVVGEEHAIVTYSTAINLDTRHGSLSLWFYAVDWEPSEKRSHVLAQLADLAIFRLFTDEDGQLVFEIGPDLEAVCRVRASLEGIERGKWTHVTATWSQTEVRLFVDGKLAGVETARPEHFTYAVDTRIQIGDQPRARGREAPRTTLIDDLTIYRRPLEITELDRVEHEITASSSSWAYEPPLVTVARTDRSSVVGGRLKQSAWDRAAKLGHFLETGGTIPASLPTTVQVAFDDECLYLSVRSPVLSGVPLRAEQKHRDDPIWTDDAVQIYLSPPDSRYRFAIIVNSTGVIYDRREHIGLDANDTSWNGNYRIDNHVGEDGWTLEIAIPFRTLETRPPKSGETWRFNVTRDRVSPQSLTTWSQLTQYTDWDKHGFVRFGDAEPAVRLERVQTLPDGRIRVEGKLLAGNEPGSVVAEMLASQGGSVLFRATQTYPLSPGESVPMQIVHDTGGATPDSVTLVVTEGDATVYRATAFFAQSSSSFQLKAMPKPGEGQCLVSLSTDHPEAESLAATVTLAPIGSRQTVRTIHMEKLIDGRGTGQFNLANLPAGTYELSATVRKGNERINQTSTEFVKPQEPWRDLGVGKSEIPPPPWPAVKTITEAGGVIRVNCWNRSYLFKDSVLPAAMTNAEAEILTSPIRLDMSVDNESVEWTDPSLELIGSNAKRADFVSSMQSRDARITTRSYVEFDGMMWFEITLTPNKALSVDSLDLVIPLDARYVTLRHVPFNVPETGAVGRDEGWSWVSKLPNAYFMWLGDNDRGLTWFYERLEQYTHADPEKTVGLTRRGEVMEFRIRYLGKKTELKEPLTLAFGLQATPVKPRLPGWRSWGAPRPIGKGISIPWTGEEVHRYGAGYPEATNPAAHQRQVQFEQQLGYRVAPYITINFQAVESPEWRYYQDDWALGSGTIKYHDHRPFWWGAYTDNSSESFADYIAWKIRQYVQDNHLDGVYHDLQWSSRTRKGDRAFRGDREVNMRLYTALKQLDPPAIKIDHASAGLCSVYHAFSDLFVVGEEMCLDPTPARPDPPNYRVYDDYFNNMRLDYFRASGAMGRQWGTTPMFLLQMRSPTEFATESIYAILLAHDAIPTWDAFARDVRFQYRLWRMLEEFGIGDPLVEFLPYWHQSTPARVTGFKPIGGGTIRPVRVMQDDYTSHPEYEPRVEDSYGASVYRLGNQRSLIVLFNFTEDDAEAELTLDLPSLGMDPKSAVTTDAYVRLSWTEANRPLRLNIRKRNCRVIWIEDRATAMPTGMALADRFPDERQEAVLAGVQPAPPPADATVDYRVAGDATKNSWALQGKYPSQYLRAEVAQIFRIERAARVHRFEVCLSDSPGPRLNRLPIGARLVRATPDGLPTDQVIVSPSQFAADRWIPSGTSWRVERFELARAIDLLPGNYALVFCKPVQFPEEDYHVRIPTRSDATAGSKVATRILNESDQVLEYWAAENQVLEFGVFGYWHQ